uniref:Uncharacterized protein n=1 Tax=Serinus canaria TaxID=9135 RepID=A0A8C9NEC2_SERCA
QVPRNHIHGPKTLLTRRIPSNPRYQHIKSRLDTGKEELSHSVQAEWPPCVPRERRKFSPLVSQG